MAGPPKPKVKIKDLLAYLDGLPAGHSLRLSLTPDRVLHIKRYVEELQYLDFTIKKLKADIAANGEIEVYQNGAQKTRRTNPALTTLLDTIKTYNQLFRQVRAIIDGVEVIW